MSSLKTVASNRSVNFNYSVEQQIEAGIKLLGWEVKAIREGRINIAGSYAFIKKGEVIVTNIRIDPLDNAFVMDKPDAVRPRKLLLHKQEIRKLSDKVDQKGFTLVLRSVYFDKNGRLKAQLCLAKGKNTVDKRAGIKERDNKRDLDRLAKSFR